MARGSRARLEAFAQALAMGQTPVEAARTAGYRPATSFASNARTRAIRRDVKARVRELQAPAVAKVMERIDLSVDWTLERLAKIAATELPSADIKASDVIAAHKLIAQIKGYLAAEKHEHGGPNGGPLQIERIRRVIVDHRPGHSDSPSVPAPA